MSASLKSDRPNLLFLTPMLPHTTGTGSAIRAGAIVACLARHFNLYVLHAALWGWHKNSFKTDFVRQHAVQYVHFIPDRGEIPMSLIVSEHFADVRFQAIHTFRLNMARVAISALEQVAGSQPFSVLDLDDDECGRAERSLKLREENGESQRRTSYELSYLRATERLLVPRFQSICLAAADDCERVRQRYPAARVVHLPNAVFLPSATPARPPSPDHVPTLLFVGTLNYFPNEDGVNYFCARVLPLLRQRYQNPIRIRLVGANPEERVTSLARYPGVEIVADVADLAPYYADADLVVVPLRAGSGTRIKILEAFSFRKPVVSTTVGAAGLSVTNGRELLIADEPAAFADACARLLEDLALGCSLAESAWKWLLDCHSFDRVSQAVQSLYEPVLETRSLQPAK